MKPELISTRLSRRRLLASTATGAVGLGVAVGLGRMLRLRTAYAESVFGEHVSATLLRMSRDIYPHDGLPDGPYLSVIVGLGSEATSNKDVKTLIDGGVLALDQVAGAAHGKDYVAVPTEPERVALLRPMEETPFFQKVRGGLLFGLYNNPELWPVFGYEGPSWEHGGYIDRGFNDLDWL